MQTSTIGMCALLLAAIAGNAFAQQPEASGRAIFRCKQADVTIFSDRPCDATAQVYAPRPDPRSSHEPAKHSLPVTVATAAKPESKPAPALQSAGVARTELAEKCLRIRQSLRDIRSKLRSGYTAAEGERLRARQLKLDEQRRFAKCR